MVSPGSIPENLQTHEEPAKVILPSDMYSRQHDIVSAAKASAYPITIVGCGHVGSTAALMLVKTGAFSTDQKLTLIDPDKVGVENMAMQFFTLRQAEHCESKVHALRDTLLDFGLARIEVFAAKFDPEVHTTDGIVVCSADDMDVRKQVLEACATNPGCRLFLDTRTGAELVQLFSIDPQSKAQVDYYMSHWKPNEEMDPDPCTARGISWTTFGITSLVGMAVGAFWRGLKFPSMISYDMANLFFDQEYYNKIKEIKYYRGPNEMEPVVTVTNPKTKFDISIFKALQRS